MVAAFVKNHTVAFNKAAGTTLALTLDTDVPAGNLIVCYMVYDNTATASKPLISSITKAAGETTNWVTAAGVNSISTTAGAFASAGVTYIRTTVTWTAGTYTVTLDTSTVMKAGAFQEFSGVKAAAQANGSNYSTTTTAASATSSGAPPAIGDLAVGFIFGSNVAAAMAGDTDTTGGSWSSVFGIGSTGSSAATNNFGVAQYKILTVASQQTLNNSAAMTAGNGAIIIILQQYVPPSITQAAYQFFDDTGTESGAASLAAVNTPVNGDITNGDGIGALRIRLQNTTAIAGDSFDDYQLQWEKNASGTWTNVVVPFPLAAEFDSSGTSGSGLGGANKMLGQSFLGNGRPLAKARFQLQNTGGAAVGNVTAHLYSHTGTFDSNGLPSTLLASSTTSIDAATLVTGVGGSPQYFEFDQTFTLVNGTPYYIVISGTAITSGTVFVYTAGLVGPGTTSRWNGSTWSAADPSDVKVAVYTVPTVTPTTVVAYDNPNLTGTGPTTNRLGAGTGSFQAGEVCEDGNVNDIALNASAYTELLYSLKILKADVVAGDVIRFRVLRNNATTGMTYTQVPTVNVIQTGTDWPATIADNWGSWTATSAATVDREPLSLDGFCFYADDAAPDTATALGPQNTQLQLLNTDRLIQLRILIYNSGLRTDNADWTLEWRALAGSFATLPDGAGAVPLGYADSPNVSGATVTAVSRITTGTGTFFNGDATETAVLPTVGLPAGRYTEVVWVLKFNAAYAVVGDRFFFRITRYGDTALVTPSVTTEILVTAPTWFIPTNVVATPTGSTTITVTWDTVPAATGYDIERNGVVIATDQPPSPYFDTGLSASTLYNYRVRAVG